MNWDDPEERRNKKIRRIGRSGAYAVGGGVGLWIMNSLYPYEPGAEKMASLFGYIGAVLLCYGLIILTTIMFKRSLAIKMNMLFIWFLLPAAIFWIFSKFWTG